MPYQKSNNLAFTYRNNILTLAEYREIAKYIKGYLYFFKNDL